MKIIMTEEELNKKLEEARHEGYEQGIKAADDFSIAYFTKLFGEFWGGQWANAMKVKDINANFAELLDGARFQK